MPTSLSDRHDGLKKDEWKQEWGQNVHQARKTRFLSHIYKIIYTWIGFSKMLFHFPSCRQTRIVLMSRLWDGERSPRRDTRRSHWASRTQSDFAPATHTRILTSPRRDERGFYIFFIRECSTYTPTSADTNAFGAAAPSGVSASDSRASEEPAGWWSPWCPDTLKGCSSLRKLARGSYILKMIRPKKVLPTLDKTHPAAIFSQRRIYHYFGCKPTQTTLKFMYKTN